MQAFPFVVSAGIYIPHKIKGGREQCENRTSTPIKAPQKRKRKDVEKKCYKVKKHCLRVKTTTDQRGYLVSNEQTKKSSRRTLYWRLITILIWAGIRQLHFY